MQSPGGRQSISANLAIMGIKEKCGFKASWRHLNRHLSSSSSTSSSRQYLLSIKALQTTKCDTENIVSVQWMPSECVYMRYILYVFSRLNWKVTIYPCPFPYPFPVRISIPLQLKIVCVAKVKCFSFFSRESENRIGVSSGDLRSSNPLPQYHLQNSQTLCRCHWCFAAHSSVFSLVMEFINISLCGPVKVEGGGMGRGLVCQRVCGWL